jgi:hypothetical protein
MYCQPSDPWFACAKRVKDAIRNTNDPAVALAAAGEWGERYQALYKANPQSNWPLDDQALLEAALEKLWEEGVGQYLDPVSLAFAMALARYAKSLSAVVEWLGGAAAVFFYALLAPSPIANDFTAAKSDNEEIARLLFSKLPQPTQGTIQIHYPAYVRRAYEECKAGGTLP